MINVPTLQFRLNTRPLLNIGYAVACGYILISIPWASIRGREFADIGRYLYTIEANEFSLLSDVFSLSGLLEGYRQEFLWQATMIYLADMSADPGWPLYAVSLASSVCFSYFLVDRIGHAKTLLVLANPLVIELLCSQIRSAYAASFLLLGLLTNSRLLKFSFIALACFTHSALVVVACIVGFSWLVYSKMQASERIIRGAVLVSFSLILALAIVYASSVILSAIGDRRANYVSDSSSVLYASYWFTIGLALGFKENSISQPYRHYIGVAAIVSCLFFFLSALGGYGSRFLAILFPVFFTAAFGLSGSTGRAFRFTLPIYTLIQYYYWIFN